MGLFDHTFHPAMAHFPIAFLAFTHTVDIAHYLAFSARLPILTSYIPLFPPFLSAAHLLHTTGLVMSTGAIVTGALDGWSQFMKHGFYEEDGKTIRPKMAVLFRHVLFNDVALGLSIWTWWRRYQAGGLLGEGTPVGIDYLLGLLSMSIMFWSASMGSDMTYVHGMGLNLKIKGTKKQQ